MNNNIDESLYSRQLYAIGKETMQSLINSKVMIVGIDSLATEICKNIILMGVGTITLADGDVKISDNDYGNYYITENDIGKKRSDILGKRLGELNNNCVINKYSGKITEQIISKYDMIVFIDFKFDEFHFKINEYCRNKNIKTIFTQSRGFFGFIFCDFCNYKTNDQNGEKIKSGLILSCNDKICVTDKDHDMTNNTKISINNNIYEIIKVINTREFVIDKEPDNLGEYQEIKDILQLNYKSLQESIKEPEFIFTDFSDFDAPLKLHDINVKILSNQYDKLNLEDTFTQKILGGYDGQLTPVNSIIGGLVAHNIISGLSNKYTPIKQWLYYDCIKICIPNHDNKLKYIAKYKNQVKVIGTELQEKINNTKLFIVGSGAIGCEHLKNFSMMGINKQIITDMDIIEKSNLSRQFLFRNTDIGKYKAEVASIKAKKMNSNVNIEYKLNRVGTDTENIFDDKFYSNIDIIVNALDNINARLYMDNKAIEYQKPLLESGTIGLKGNTQVIIPNKTESYGSTTDKAEDQIPICTLKNFPYEIAHCIQWAREQFESLFVLPFQTYNKLKKFQNENKLQEKLDKMMPNEIYDMYQHLEIIKNNPKYALCNFFNNNYRQKINDLITKYPENHVTENGEKFWSGTRKFPNVIDYDESSPVCKDLTESFIKIMKHIGFLSENNEYTNLVINISLTETNNANIATTSDEEKLIKETELNLMNIDEMKTNIIQLITQSIWKYNEIEFEKDDDNNGHIKFITACSNIRAQNYSINTSSEFETKGIAGKIIPALATTTAIVSGLVAIELYKLINDKDNYNIENFKNTFTSLGISFMGSSEPVSCKSTKVGNLNITLWTKLYYKNMNISDLIDILRNTYNVDTDIIMYNNTAIYTSYMLENKKKEILNKDIYKLLGKNKNIILNVNISDEKDNSEIILIEII
jgi:ubiquitin-activating enzyme E1